jgi:ubiquinone/menaquinone biosynthesis C-methylase UbiE
MEKSEYMNEQVKLLMSSLSMSLQFYMLEYSIKNNLFEILNNDFLSLEEIKEKVGFKCNERNFRDFLDLLFVNKHLLREGPIDSPKYKTADETFLKSNPNNLCSLVGYWQRPYRRLIDLEKFFTEGKSGNLFKEIYQTEEEKFDFLKTMLHIQIGNFTNIAEKFDFPKYKSLIDIGGGLGAFAVAVKKRHADIEASSFDLPGVKPLAERYLKETGMEGKVSLIGGDMFNDELPKCDVVSMGNILHDWNHEIKQKLFKKAFDMLNEGGAFLIIEKFIDDERKVETPGLISSMVMLIECYEGFNMSIKDIEVYANEVGFKQVEAMKDINLAICYK